MCRLGIRDSGFGIRGSDVAPDWNLVTGYWELGLVAESWQLIAEACALKCAAIHCAMRNYMDLTGRMALVTGASSGIGAATATTLADLGASVGIAYHRNQEGAEATRDAIIKAGGRAIAVAADVRSGDAVRSLVGRVTAELGPIDVLVNNAGSLVMRRNILEITEEQLDEILALNLKSAVLASQAVAAGIIERRSGAIINIVSIAGHTGGGPGAGA